MNLHGADVAPTSVEAERTGARACQADHLTLAREGLMPGRRGLPSGSPLFGLDKERAPDPTILRRDRQDNGCAAIAGGRSCPERTCHDQTKVTHK